MKYVDYVKDFSNPIVVFDGYNNISTKYSTHERRTKGISSPRVQISSEIQFKLVKALFFPNIENIQSFINFLSERMTKNGIQTIHSDGDADLLIAQTAVNKALINTTHVIAEDTDILVLILHHIRINTVGLFFKSDKGNSRYPLWDISYIHSQLGVGLCKHLPFLHALGGSDVTSRLFGICKGAVIKKKDRLIKYSEVFASKDIYHLTIKEVGEKALVCLYGERA